MGTHKTMLLLLLLHGTLLCSLVTASSPKLVPEEVAALKKIAEKLGKKNWDFATDPCSGIGTWNVKGVRGGFDASVACQCPNSSACHVVSLDLKSQNLTGVLPPEFSNLGFLNHLDLSRNLLTGSVPSQWASMKLIYLSLMGNKLAGPFPSVLTKITTLTNLSIEGNLFSGPIPSVIGNLVNLQKCIISSNKFSGELPAQLASLLSLTDLRLNDNEFSGKLPEFLSSFTQIQKLHIEGSGFEGPIPSSFFSLKNLKHLRISDLRGNVTSTLPTLQAMESLKILSLRNCLIEGSIPNIIGTPGGIKHLDLSFNSFSGSLPIDFKDLIKADFIYLTSNKLTGALPSWLLARTKPTDLSYNNFSLDPSSAATCPSDTVNFAESCSPSNDKSLKLNSCTIRDFPCNVSERHQRFSLHINCGGDRINEFEADTNMRGASAYINSNYWAFSSTGNIMDNENAVDAYIITNSTPLLNVSSPFSDLFKTARISPLSLTYYGLCLYNGNYNVTLHFAEIVFADDNTLNSLGRRVFDVYIQDELKLKDFEIAKDAGGAGRPLNKTFNVNVNDNKLKIHFYWAGKGTTGIPIRGNYGPLVSAISVDPNYKPPVFTDSKTRTLRIAVGVAAGVFVLAILLVVVFLYKIRGRNHEDEELRGLGLQTGIFTNKQLKAATNNFDTANKLGEGGFGAVYKGLLADGTTVAVKLLSTKTKQGNREFINEIGMISAVQHPNLLRLLGCCVEGNQLILVYEYMENNCLSRALFGEDGGGKLVLDWPTRRRICTEIARGLAYLHEESIFKIVHRDIKASNVLLDRNLNAKISDFGLAKLKDDDKTHISTRVAGTIGYMSPEYAMRGYLTDKADVYSFGVVALEVVSGKSNTNFRPKDEFMYLLDWANVLHERGSLVKLIDPELKLDYVLEEVIVVLHVALMCTNASPTLRPSMSEVVSILEGRSAVRHPASDVSRSSDFKMQFWGNVSVSNEIAMMGSNSATSSNLETDITVTGSFQDEKPSHPFLSL